MVEAKRIRENYLRVMENVEKAAARAGRSLSEVTVIAVTKTFALEIVKAAKEAGITHFGENYVQEALEKIKVAENATWHFIGRLQRNKAKYLPGNFQWVHSIDKAEVASTLERRAAGAEKTLHVLIQVNIAEEPTKGGVAPEKVQDLLDELLQFQFVKPRGLMIIPPLPEKPEDSRKWFVKLRELRDQLKAKGYPSEALQHLSMGMTDDYTVAVEEGSTMVRIGRAIFGERRLNR